LKNFIKAIVSNSIKLILGIILAAIVIFIWQNWDSLTGVVTLKFFSSAQYPLWFWLVIIFLTGNISWAILTLKSKRLLKKALNQKSVELNNSKIELDKFRKLSIKDDLSILDSDTPIRDTSNDKKD